MLKVIGIVASEHGHQVCKIYIVIEDGACQSDKSILPVEDIRSLRVYLSIGLEDCGVEVIAMRRFDIR